MWIIIYEDKVIISILKKILKWDTKYTKPRQLKFDILKFQI